MCCKTAEKGEATAMPRGIASRQAVGEAMAVPRGIAGEATARLEAEEASYTSSCSLSKARASYTSSCSFK
jgi:hypothetical protein